MGKSGGVVAQIASPLVAGIPLTVAEPVKDVKEAEERAKKEAERQRQEAVANEQAWNDRVSKEQAAAASTKKKSLRAMSNFGRAGRRSTILTSPLGVTGDYSGTQKTLLGS